MTTDPDRTAWAEALTLYERRYTFVAVGPREHPEWGLDLASLVRGTTRDPRAWRSLDPDQDEEERQDDAAFPFVAPPTTEPEIKSWRAHLTEVPRGSAKRLLVVLGTQYLDVTREREFDHRRPEMEGKADVLLSRFPVESRFYANTGYEGANPDFYQAVTGVHTFSQYDWDVGLVIVSESEVGLFWSFDAT
ncbi:hypothetical protein [Streptomyces sp. NPDC005953]|uniref:hypothetical protein n=1 Tax=unclassified Streptomyces TaxID=2593676 RepID=UPI0033E18CFF